MQSYHIDNRMQLLGLKLCNDTLWIKEISFRYADADYETIEQLAVTFQPGQMRVTLPFTVMNDNIVEPTENFGLLVSRKLDNPNLVLDIDTAVITIPDTDCKDKQT